MVLVDRVQSENDVSDLQTSHCTYFGFVDWGIEAGNLNDKKVINFLLAILTWIFYAFVFESNSK